jgi:hypothetical protein
VKVISIVSAGRSGSTLLDMLLGSIDGFFSAGEVRYLWERGLLQHRLCGCGREVSECEVWSKVLAEPSLARLDPAEVVRWQHSVARVRHTRRLLREKATAQHSAQLSQLIDTMGTLYEEVGRVAGAHVIVDSSKRPADAALAALVPGVEVYVIHLVRDPRAVAFSRGRRKAEFDHESRPEMERASVARATANWTWLNTAAGSIPRIAPEIPFTRVRYEDAVARPAAALAQILEFIGEPAAPSALHDHVATFRPNHTVSGNPNRFSTGCVEVRADDEWRRSMSALSWGVATAIAAPLGPRYGYAFGSGAPWRRSSVPGEQALEKSSR